ncbi:MAG: DUF6512 family protein [Clostridia bacterium]
MHLKLWHILGTLFTIIIGTLLHFTYDWSGNVPIVGLFSPINESTWEHLKLLAMPMLVWAFVAYFAYGRHGYPNFVSVTVLSILVGMAAIVVVFYTYTGIVGRHALWMDIATFIIGVILAYQMSYRLLQTPYLSSGLAVAQSWVGLVLILAAFLLFTDFPPHLALFRDPVSGHFGRNR